MTQAIALKGVLQAYTLETTFRILAGLMALLIVAGITFIEKKKARDERAVVKCAKRPRTFNTVSHVGS